MTIITNKTAKSVTFENNGNVLTITPCRKNNRYWLNGVRLNMWNTDAVLKRFGVEWNYTIKDWVIV